MSELPADTKITCPNGHYIATTRNPLISERMVVPEDFVNFTKKLGQQVTGATIPRCPECGERWITSKRERAPLGITVPVTVIHTENGWWPHAPN